MVLSKIETIQIDLSNLKLNCTKLNHYWQFLKVKWYSSKFKGKLKRNYRKLRSCAAQIKMKRSEIAYDSQPAMVV